MFEIIFICAVAVYFIQLAMFIIGINKKYIKNTNYDDLPSASIVIAARNEENNILRCLESLDRIVYPEGKLEIIIVDDRSTDLTKTIADNFIQGRLHFKCITTPDDADELKGKANALANGIKIASGEIILTTDADCAVNPLWALTTASYYTKDVAIVCGYTSQKFSGVFTGMQMLDFMYLLGVAAGVMNLGKPLSCIGNNMSYRKSAYKEVGGYEAHPFSVTEDFTMLMSILKLKKYKIIFPMDADNHVVSNPCNSYKELYWQKKRWGVGGLKSDFAGFAVMSSGFIANCAILLLPFFFSAGALYCAIFKIFSDLLFLYSILKTYKLTYGLKYFMAFEIYFVSYVVLLPFSVLLSRKVKWKGRTF